MSADLSQFHHGLSVQDVWDGKVRARYVLMLAGQLHLNPYSRVRMIELGGDVRWIGWDANAEIAADQFDQLTAIVSGFGKHEVSPSDLYTRPGRSSEAPPAEEELYAPSIAAFNVGAFMKEVAA